MKKDQVIQAVMDALRAEFEEFAAISRQTRNSGNDEESKAEGKYDTRSTEENYLADGQARHAQVAAGALQAWQDIPIRNFEGQCADLGALVLAKYADEEELWFLLGPAAGGLEVKVGKTEITVVTPDSPLGSRVMGRREGERCDKPPVQILRVL